jgi:hypothetical protein
MLCFYFCLNPTRMIVFQCFVFVTDALESDALLVEVNIF